MVGVEWNPDNTPQRRTKALFGWSISRLCLVVGREKYCTMADKPAYMRSRTWPTTSGTDGWTLFFYVEQEGRTPTGIY